MIINHAAYDHKYPDLQQKSELEALKNLHLVDLLKNDPNPAAVAENKQEK